MLYFSSFSFMSLMLLGVSLLTCFLGMLFFSEMKVVVVEWELLNLNSTTIMFSIILDWMGLISLVWFVLFLFLLSCLANRM